MALADVIVRIGADISDLETALQTGGGKLADFGDRISGVGQALSLGVTAPVLAAGAAAIKFASDAEESASKFEAVFGDAAGEVAAAIVDMRATIPATTAELQGMTAEIQDILVPMGVVPERAQEMTLEIARLAADLGSFNNIPTAEALERIRAGLVGSNEPLLKFGVAINAAMVESEALRQGLIRQGEALTPAARAQAAFALILERTTAAHGDAARTADSTANQFKFLRAEAVEAATAFGVVMLPAVTAVVSAAVDLIRRFQGLDDGTRKIIIVLGLTAAAVGPLLVVAGSLLSAFASLTAIAGALGIGVGALLAPVAAAAAALAAVVTVGVLVAKNWDVLSFEAKRLVDFVAAQFARFTPIFEAVAAGTERVVGFFSSMFDVVVGNSIVPDMVDGIGTEFARLEPLMAGAAERAAERTNQAFKNIVNPSALRSLDFNVTLDAEQLYESVIAGSAQAGVALFTMATRTEIARATVSEFSGQLGNNLAAAQALADEHRAMQAAEAALAHQQKILAQIVGLEVAPGMNRTTASLATLTPALDASTFALRAQAPVVAGLTQSQSFFASVLDGAQSVVGAAGSSLGGALATLGQGALGVLNKLSPMGAAAEVVQRVFAHLEPAIKAFEPAIDILAKALAAGLLPILKALFPVFKLVAIAATYVGQIFFRVAQGIATAIGYAVRAIGVLIDKLPFVSGESIINAGESLLETARGFGQAAEDLGAAREELKALEWPAGEQAMAAVGASQDRTTEAVLGGVEATRAAELAIREEAGVLTSMLGVLQEIRDGIAALELSPVINVNAPGGTESAATAGSNDGDSALGNRLSRTSRLVHGNRRVVR